jgi:hypothetical protein
VGHIAQNPTVQNWLARTVVGIIRSVMTSDLALDALHGGKSVFMWGKDLNLLSFVVRVAGKTIRNARMHVHVGNALNVARSVSAFRGRAEVMVLVSKRRVYIADAIRCGVKA